ncbi:hypothetical protein KJ762_12335 [bacterium]|nr:hypothetical protein [bacterium]
MEKRLHRVIEIWPELKRDLEHQLVGFSDFKTMLQQVDAPVSPMDIGIGLDRLRESYGLAQLIWKRYRILDFTQELGIFEICVTNIFNSEKY